MPLRILTIFSAAEPLVLLKYVNLTAHYEDLLKFRDLRSHGASDKMIL